MANVDLEQLGPLFYTGKSPFLEANQNFVRALVSASANCPIHASEDIFDAGGMKLWARGRPIDDRLLERLLGRKLRKPIELCVYAADPVATAAIAQTIEERVAHSAELIAVLEPGLERVLRVVTAIIPSPTELLMLSVLRHDECNRMDHAALVCAIALVGATTVDMHPDLMRTLARAALLHDIGELYLPLSLFGSPAPLDADRVHAIRRHPLIGAQVAIELARSGATVGHLIAMSHERLDGSGYPRALQGDRLPLAAQALLFAEAVAALLESGPNCLQRAAVSTRVVPGEFATEMVNWISRSSRTVPLLPQALPQMHLLGERLRNYHSQLARVLVLLRLPVHETVEVRSAAEIWLKEVEALMRMLRMSGVEDAIASGAELEPQPGVETFELSVLCGELRYRTTMLRLRAQLLQAETPELGTSNLVIQMIEILDEGAAQPAPVAGEAALA